MNETSEQIPMCSECGAYSRRDPCLICRIESRRITKIAVAVTVVALVVVAVMKVVGR